MNAHRPCREVAACSHPSAAPTSHRKLPFGVLTRFAGLTAIFILSHCGQTASGQNWLAEPSYFTHDPQTGQRVNQFYQRTSVVHTPSPYRSVYRQSRSSLQVGDSIDHYHTVDRYGEPVRPYGEWRFPYRPFSVPYPQWGPIYPGGGFGFPYPYHFGGGGGGYWGPYGPSGVINGAGFPPPWNDGSYPDVRRTQLPPQPFPSPTFNQSINNDVTGDGNTIQNQ